MNTHQLKARYDILLREIEKAGPVFTRIRLLEKQIENGETKIAAAEAVDASNPKLRAAREKVAGYRAELRDLQERYQVPHFAYAWLDSMRRSIEDKDWPVTGAPVLSIKLPGLLEVELTLDTKIPF